MRLLARRGTIVVVLAFGCAGVAPGRTPAPAPSDPVTAKGFASTDVGRDEVATAIGHANQLLAETRVRFRPSWSETGGRAGDVPVYLVAAPPQAVATPVAVPRGYRCVFVNPSLLHAWLRRHTEGDGRLDVDLPYVLTFMLLHEAGHLANGGGDVQFVDGGVVETNIDPTFEKQGEEAADDFAVQLIRDYTRRREPFAAIMVAEWTAVALTKLSWNMQAYRTLDEFAAAATNKRAVFFDESYTHPNLAWRILRSNALIQDSPETRALLAAFEDARRAARGPAPLYSREPATR